MLEIPPNTIIIIIIFLLQEDRGTFFMFYWFLQKWNFKANWYVACEDNH